MNQPDASALVFPSKIDWWLGALLIVAGTFSASMAIIAVLVSGLPWKVNVLIIGGEALVIGFVAWTFTTTRYLVGDGDLLVRSGPFRWRIALASIGSIVPTNNPLSSPALSLDRLE